MGREGRHAHRHDGPLGGRQGSHRREELVRPSPVHDAQDGVSTLGQAQRTLPAVLGFLMTLDQTAPHQAVDKPTCGRRRAADRLRQLPDRQRAAVGEDVQRRELGEPEAQLPELTGKTDDQLAPERPAHRHALTDLADVRKPVAGGKHGRREVGLELTGDGARGGRAGGMPRRWTVFGHATKRSLSHGTYATMHGSCA